MMCIPSQTSRWYACRSHRICRSSGLSMCKPKVFFHEADSGRLTSSGGFSAVDVADNDDVDVELLLTASGYIS